MTVVESRPDLWEVLAGRAAGASVSPADELLSQAVRDRLALDRATPHLLPGVEAVEQVSARDSTYVMLRSPHRRRPCYLRLTPEEWVLVQRMDGSRTVARLVSEFMRISGRFAAEQVTRLVGDLAAASMVDHLPRSVLSRPEDVPRQPFARRFGAILRGRPVLTFGIDPLFRVAHLLGGRALFSQAGATIAAFVGLAGLVGFGRLWILGEQPIFYAAPAAGTAAARGDPSLGYLTGALILLGLYAVVLAVHEFGRALAVKNAGRRVPVAGLRLYYGVPSLFFDASDLWMASRTGRLVAAAAGQASALVVAGAACLVALVWPPLAPWAVKFAFVAYLHVLLCLNPFVALDGYHLLVDWLEVPNLRTRALIWTGSLVRRRGRRYTDLDGEGRLIALYGMVGIAWLLIAVNVGWRVYADRLSGLVTGLWYGRWFDRALLIAVVVGLAAPLLAAIVGRMLRAWGRWRQRAADSQVQADFPYRLDVLRACALGGLPPVVLAELARDARWLRPVDGRQLLDRGVRVGQVYVVVGGVAEARRPGDPAGVVRQRVGPGGVIGLANAVTGSPASYSWYTVGATLLAIPVPALVAALGPLPAPAPTDLAELEDLLDETPQFAALSAEAYLGLTVHAEVMQLRPGEPVVLPNGSDAALVSGGVVERYDGRAVQRGTVLGPYGNDEPSEAGLARTPARVWRLPSLTALSPLPAGPVGLVGVGGAHRGPSCEPHQPAVYPPLVAPPWPPPADLRRDADRRFEGWLRWLLAAAVLAGLLLGAANIWYGPAWAELPPNRALLTVSAGAATVDAGAGLSRLTAGDERYLASGARIDVASGSAASLQYRGGAIAVLCAGASVTLGTVSGRAAGPSAAVTLREGRLLADTAGTSAGYRPLALTVQTGSGDVATAGVARLAVATPADVQLARGSATFGGEKVKPGGVMPTCADGAALPEPSFEATSEPPASPGEPFPQALPSLSASASASGATSESASPSVSAIGPTATGPNPPPAPPPPPPPPPAPAPAKPVVSEMNAEPGQICNDQPWTVTATATDADSGEASLQGSVTLVPVVGAPGAIPMTRNGSTFTAEMPPLSLTGDPLVITVTVAVTDASGNTGTRTDSVQWNPVCLSMPPSQEPLRSSTPHPLIAQPD